MKTLLKMLTYRRPHNGKTELEFIKKFLPFTFDVDAAGNMYYTVGEDSRTLFVAHLDTVHHEDGIQEIIYDTHLNVVYKPHGSKDCLGADDGAGVWLLSEMMKAGVPGTYIFTRGEERGGIGAKHIAQFNRDYLSRFDRAIAFDRRGTRSVITHQWAGRCCSDAFGLALARKLNEHGFEYELDDTGVYTDTAEFTDIIPECTNLSCGYEHEHGPEETLDVDHIERLLQACLKVDWESLPVKRNPLQQDSYTFLGTHKKRNSRTLEFEIVKVRYGFELWAEDEFIMEHESFEFLAGYATCYAETQGATPIILEEILDDYDADPSFLRWNPL